MAEQLATAPDPSLIAARADMLAWHSPVSFLRNIPVAVQQVRYGTGTAARFGAHAGEQVLPMAAPATGQWLLRHLPWDTQFFGTDTYRLFTGLFDRESAANLAAAAVGLRVELARRGPYYAFGMVPAEDTALLQALTAGGWQLVETRLNFYRPTADPLPVPPQAVRFARPEEAEAIGRVSASARNDYDRFHADPWFGDARADAMLARYAEAAVRGNYADAVLVPAEAGLPVDSFLAIGDAPAEEGVPGSATSRVLLTAVGPQNRGWHLKLVAEAIRRAAQTDASYVLMTTQATNRAVFRTCEKLGFCLGSTTHVVACHGR